MASGGSGVKADELANSGTANTMSSNLGGNAGQLYGSLAPQLEAEAAHPVGYTQPQLAAMNTSAQQSAGGANAGAVGQGALLAARTKNAGTADAAIAQSGRQASQQLGKSALDISGKNADLQQTQQQEGLRGEQGLYGTELGASQNALGLSNQALGLANQAKPTFLQQLGSQAAFGALSAAQAAAGGG